MATSPIYSWPEPDNTDLVKNGALAIRTLGNAIDTTMGTMVAKTVVDAKGDLIAGTAADTVNRLAVGSNGETLVADSSTSTGLRYQSAYNGNSVINGAFDIAQRGTSISVGAAYPYTLDRWQAVRGGVVAGMTVSRQSSGLTGFQYCARIQRDSGNTSTGTLQLFNAFESANSYQFAGQAVTFSFYARAGANYSGGALSGFIGTGTGTDQNPITSVYTGGASSITVSATLNGSTWTRYQGTATLPSGTTEMYVNFTYTPTGTAGANDYVEITGVQVEMGSIATTFKRAGGTIQGELAACQRYFYKLAGGSSTIALGSYVTNTEMRCNVVFPVTMRTNPTLVSTTGASSFAMYKYPNSYDFFDSFTLDIASTTNAVIKNTTEMSTSVFVSGFLSTDSGSASVSFNGEL